MMEHYIDIVNIQRFSLHDGPGIRTTIFLRGCQLRCPWCCNPESWMINSSVLCGNRNNRCGLFTLSQISQLLDKDKSYFLNGNKYWKHGMKDETYRTLPGGVTYSGGEPALHMQKLEPMLKFLNSENIHQAMETSLFCPEEELKIALKYLDLIYFDIKLLNKEECSTVLKGDLDLFKKNVHIVLNERKKVIIRIPLIKNYTDTDKNLEMLIKYLEEIEINKNPDILRIELLKGHNLGHKKYSKLCKKNTIDCVPNENCISLFMDSLSSFHIDLVLLSI